MNVSASDLIKRSATQIWYLRSHRNSKTISKAKLAGKIHQASKTKSKYVEMRNSYTEYGTTINFCVDEIRPGSTSRLIEHKMTKGKCPDWYFQSSILQVALYHSLAWYTKNRWFQTATFAVKQGQTLQRFKLDHAYISLLKFGNKTYFIKPTDPIRIIDFYLNKARLTDNYHDAKLYDNNFKGLDWEYLRHYIKFKPWKRGETSHF